MQGDSSGYFNSTLLRLLQRSNNMHQKRFSVSGSKAENISQISWLWSSINMKPSNSITLLESEFTKQVKIGFYTMKLNVLVIWLHD